MPRTLQLMAALVLLSTAGGAGAQPETSDARAVLRVAAEAARALQSATYEARVQVSTGGVVRRTVTGEVHLVRFPYSDPVGGMLAVRGEIDRTDGTDAEPFQIAYDGETVGRLVDSKQLLLQADLHYGGQGLLGSAGTVLILDDLLAEEPFTAERDAPLITYASKEEIDGVPCDVLDVQYEKPHTAARWYFGVEDHLPRKHQRQFRSARGNEITSVLTVRNLRVNGSIDESLFTIEPPAGYAMKTMGTKPPKPVKVGDMVPDWTLADDEGREYSLSDYRGQVVVLDFFATWCDYCQRAMPAVQRMHDQYRDRGVAVFSLSCRERSADVNPAEFVRGRGFTYPVLDGNALAPQYQVRGIPAFYVIGPDGRLLYSRSGFNEQREQRMIQIIEQQLALIGG